MLTYHFTTENVKQNRMPFLDVQIIWEFKTLLLPSTANQFLVEFIYIYIDFYHLFSLIDTFGYAQFGQNHTPNYVF